MPHGGQSNGKTLRRNGAGYVREEKHGLSGSCGLSEVESGGPSAQRRHRWFEPGLSLVLLPGRCRWRPDRLL